MTIYFLAPMTRWSFNYPLSGYPEGADSIWHCFSSPTRALGFPVMFTGTSKNKARGVAVGLLAMSLLGLSVTTNTAAVATDVTYDNPKTQFATGAFAMTTAPGILPALTSAGITLEAISPGTRTTSVTTATTRISLPVVAKTGTANATAGGFKFTNTKTRESISCLIPTIDTRARVIDCKLNTGFNDTLFLIDTIDSREFLDNGSIRTGVFTGMTIKVKSTMSAQTLNDTLDTTVFSSSVTFANANLTVTRTAS